MSGGDKEGGGGRRDSCAPVCSADADCACSRKLQSSNDIVHVNVGRASLRRKTPPLVFGRVNLASSGVPVVRNYRRRVATLALRNREKRCFGDTSFRKNRPTSVLASCSSIARFKCRARVRQVQRGEKRIDGEAKWLGTQPRRVSREPSSMVFENIEMRNPTGFLLEDARHGYIQYIRYLRSLLT